MKTFKKAIMMAGMVAAILAFSHHNAYAAGDSRDITVSYMPDKAFPKVILSVETAGKGSIADGDSLIREGTVLYELQEDDSKLLRILPDQGWQIGKAILDDGYEETDIPEKMKDSGIEITMKDTDASLSVIFEKIPQKNQGGQSGDTRDGKKNHLTGTRRNPRRVKTGDQTDALLWLGILAASGAALGIGILKKKRKRQDV